MADCGAAGSTLDRAARALLGAGDAKAAASLLGHVAAAAGAGGSAAQQLPMGPLTAPDSIALPAQPAWVRPAPAVRHQSQDVAVAAAVEAHQSQHRAATAGVLQQQEHFLRQQQQQLQHQQHHSFPQHMQLQQQMQIQQQQQMMIMMQQQQLHQLQHMAAMQQRQQQQQQASRSTAATAQELLAEEPEYSDGAVRGATIEELAAAWAEAEADYEELEAAVDLAAATEMNEFGGQALPEYEFLHSGIDESGAVPLERAAATTSSAAQDAASPPTDWMERGLRDFANGNLNDAVRDFEMELQQNNMDNATAWRMLGLCHAENDQDRLAIVCLEQAVDRDPYCQEARLALGVSYVNELNHAKALEHLKAWITHNPKYAQLEIGEDLYGAGSSGDIYTEPGFDEVQRLLLRALDFDPSDAADVLGALGVVYNVSRDYDAAVDAFQKALEIQGENYQLYNRLGATLANCNRSEEALPAYQRALALKPRFTRAWLNLAISHANMQNYDEAARCYLQTLSLNPAATHCWSYLRVALSSGHRWDLLPHAASMDLEPLRAHFDFV